MLSHVSATGAPSTILQGSRCVCVCVWGLYLFYTYTYIIYQNIYVSGYGYSVPMIGNTLKLCRLDLHFTCHGSCMATLESHRPSWLYGHCCCHKRPCRQQSCEVKLLMRRAPECFKQTPPHSYGFRPNQRWNSCPATTIKLPCENDSMWR